MTANELFQSIQHQKSFLCVGLDSDVKKIPNYLPRNPDGILSFNQKIIEATLPFAVAYKPNLAFYEALGAPGWEVLKETVDLIPNTHFKIADAKRGDIGNTADQYAKAFFEDLNFDAITLNPYMGMDSISPFLEYPEKWVIILGLTSNPGSQDFQLTKTADGKYFFEQVLETASKWGSPEKVMFVVGATHPTYFKKVRKIVPDHFLLVPGIGAQGGDLSEVYKYGVNHKVGLLVNSSRSILYASHEENFNISAADQAAALRNQMSKLLNDENPFNK
jgi:orotidine-5'-phosphate decarboxylase